MDHELFRGQTKGTDKWTDKWTAKWTDKSLGPRGRTMGNIDFVLF